MPLFINEDRKELGKKKITIPKSMRNHLDKTREMYKGYESHPGFKRLKKYTEETPYNDRSNGKAIQKNSDTKQISFSDAKRTLSDMVNIPNKKSLKYILNGGAKFEEFLHNAIKQARGANQVKKVKEVPKLTKAQPKAPELKTKSIKVSNGNVRLESLDKAAKHKKVYLSEEQIKLLKDIIN